MVQQETIDTLRKGLFSDSGRIISKRLTEKNLKKHRVFDIIEHYRPNFPKDYSLSYMILALCNGYEEAPKCQVCGALVRKNTEGSQVGFRKFCSPQCMGKDPKFKDRMINRDEFAREEKRKKTNLEKYGYEYNSQRPDIKLIVAQKSRDFYVSRESQIKLDDRDWLYEQHITNERTLGDIAKELGVHDCTVSCACEDAEIIKRTGWTASTGEKQVLHFVREFFPEALSTKSVLKRRELDIYVHSKKLAIEYNGLWTHCEKNKGVDYHKEKYDECSKLGIQLLSIFEDEWELQQDKVKSFIKSKLGMYERKLFAKYCVVREIPKKLAKQFLDNYHLQDSANIYKCYGLFHEEELVGVVSYNWNYRKNGEMTLNRLAFKSDVLIVGGASKLVKTSLPLVGISPITTMSDNRWSNGKIYEICGFNLLNELGVEYSYVRQHGLTRLPKYKMSRKVWKYPADVTERTYTTDLGWYRIYDCGKKKWIWSEDTKKPTEVGNFATI